MFGCAHECTAAVWSVTYKRKTLLLLLMEIEYQNPKTMRVVFVFFIHFSYHIQKDERKEPCIPQLPAAPSGVFSQVSLSHFEHKSYSH